MLTRGATWDFGGVRGANFVLQKALNCLNLKWQVVEHVGKGLKRPIWKMPCIICNYDEAFSKAGVLTCQLDPH